MINIAIFASGNGSNAENIAGYFKDDSRVNIKTVLTNNENATVIKRMKSLDIPTVYFPKDTWTKGEKIVNYLKEEKIDLIVLAGFMNLIVKPIIDAYGNRIINIHPSLLPKFGGKGMYGMNVHKAVINANEPESGITIHHVTEEMDNGNIIFQARCDVLPDDTPELLAERIHNLEYIYYPQIIKKILFENHIL